MTEAEIRADERKRIAAFVADFSWVLPIYGDVRKRYDRKRFADLNAATDEAACSVCDQIATAILNLDANTETD